MAGVIVVVVVVVVVAVVVVVVVLEWRGRNPVCDHPNWFGLY